VTGQLSVRQQIYDKRTAKLIDDDTKREIAQVIHFANNEVNVAVIFNREGNQLERFLDRF
jgi:hypothetical protein